MPVAWLLYSRLLRTMLSADPIHVDRRPAGTVIVDSIVLHQPVRKDAIPAHAGIAVEVQAAVGVFVQAVAAHGEIIAAVVDIEPCSPLW